MSGLLFACLCSVSCGQSLASWVVVCSFVRCIARSDSCILGLLVDPVGFDSCCQALASWVVVCSFCALSRAVGLLCPGVVVWSFEFVVFFGLLCPGLLFASLCCLLCRAVVVGSCVLRLAGSGSCVLGLLRVCLVHSHFLAVYPEAKICRNIWGLRASKVLATWVVGFYS